MIPKTSKELLDNLKPSTSSDVNVIREFQNLQAKRPTKFLLKKIYHEEDKHTYVWKMGEQFVVMTNDVYALCEVKTLQQLKMDL